MVKNDPGAAARRAAVRPYVTPSDLRGAAQVLNTLGPIALLWWAAGALGNGWAVAALVLPLTLFNVRVFALLHDCGHGSLFRTQALNRTAGFVFGVVSGMPQYVWSKHHDFHHRTNGDWDRYRGPLGTLTLEEYAALGPAAQRRFRQVRNLALAPLAGFAYLLLNPRVNWLRGTLALGSALLRGKLAAPARPWREIASGFKPRYWKTWREYAHMTANNVVLLTLWWLLAGALGAGKFFALYFATVALAGGIGIVLFSVQHNFEHSYASNTPDWDMDDGVMHGTSYLVLPGVLNWFTADIGYHHVHHLSAAVPNYRLARCHRDHAALFAGVRRLTLRDVPHAVGCVLWDQQARRLVHVDSYRGSILNIAPGASSVAT